ncbi:GFA family protein, partial [Salmonella enterica]
MQTFTGRCLCGQSHFTVDVEMLDVYACHCTLCQKWSGGIAMYLEACGQPQLAPLS